MFVSWVMLDGKTAKCKRLRENSIRTIEHLISAAAVSMGAEQGLGLIQKLSESVARQSMESW